MSDNVVRHKIADGIEGLYVKTSLFKTRRITVSFVLPVDAKSAASAAILSRLLVSSCEKYPEYSSLQRALNMLYGAKFSGGVLRTGDLQILKFSAESLCDKYALLGENVASDTADLLLNMIFEPNLPNGMFDKEDFDREKRLLIESINSRINSKRKYAVETMIENMCCDEPFGVPASGGLEAAQQLCGEDVFEFYKNIILSAPVCVFVTGDESPQDVYGLVRERFKSYGGVRDNLFSMVASPYSDKVKNIEETMPITQGKLVMGFKTQRSSALSSVVDMQVFADIFGGAPYSLLFTVVREKMSLCYYCAARFYSLKGILCIDSGIEFENFENSKKGILEQLERIQNGDFDEELINASKIGLADSLRSVYDSAAGIESWYMSRMFDKEILSPDEYISAVQKVTKEDITKAASDVRLDTVFFLKGDIDS